MTPEHSRLEARDRFLEGAGPDRSVRAEISASWRRARLNGVPPDRLPDPPTCSIDLDSPLARAARPVLDRIADEIGDSALSVMLTDGRARIIERRVGIPRLRAALDSLGAIPGAGLAEEDVGTNGVGTCIETRRPVIVTGGEHFVAPFVRLACAGAPILHPFTGRVEGVLDVTAPAEEASGLMLAYVREAAAGIAQRLEELAGRGERALFDTFRSAIRRASGPVLTMNGDLVIANAAASRLLDAVDHLLVWEQVAAIMRGSASSSVRLAGGTMLRAEVVPVTVDGRPVGALVRFADGSHHAAGRRTMAPRGDELEGLVGHSSQWLAVCRRVAGASSSLPVLVAGEDGTGKLAVAGALHQRSGAGRALEVVDAAGDGWLERLVAADAATTVIVRHLDAVPADLASRVVAMLDRSAARMIATATATWSADGPRVLLDRFPVQLIVPTLRERRDDIVDLVAALVRRHGDQLRQQRVSPDAVRALVAHDWPGNVRQLESVVRHALARRPHGDVTVDDLPIDLRAAPDAALTTMQRIEREAIVRALDEAQGNRAAAAEHLGISRSTLYRRLATYGVV